MSAKLIDVERVISEKNPKLLKRIPGFLIRYLKRILHQDEINSILAENEGIRNEYFCRNVMKTFSIQVEMEGLQNVPATGGIILSCNHPLGGMDALALVDKFSNHRKDFKFIVNDILMNLGNLADLFIGVNKHGTNAMGSLNQVNNLFNSEQAVFIFPAGLVSRKSGGKISDLEWKKTFVTRARKYRKPIVPVWIDGRLSNFFYRFANFRKFLGIKSNIEMLYLADEQFKLKGSTIRIRFGPAIMPEEMDNGWSDSEWTEEIRTRVYSLGIES